MALDPLALAKAKAAATAARLNASLVTAQQPTNLQALAGQAAAAVARINAQLGVSTPATAAAPQALWPWAKQDSSAEQIAFPDEKSGEDEYLKLSNVTLKGLRKLGYQGGPVMGEKEAAGLRFGLHRAGFHGSSAGKLEFKSIRLLVGMEVEPCAQLGFPVLERLQGPSKSYLLHIMRSCPGAIVAVQGRGCTVAALPGSEASDEPLHLKITSTEESIIRSAQTLAESLIATVKAEFDAVHQAFLAQQHASSLVAPAPMMSAAGASVSQHPSSAPSAHPLSGHIVVAHAPPSLSVSNSAANDGITIEHVNGSSSASSASSSIDISAASVGEKRKTSEPSSSSSSSSAGESDSSSSNSTGRVRKRARFAGLTDAPPTAASSTPAASAPAAESSATSSSVSAMTPSAHSQAFVPMQTAAGGTAHAMVLPFDASVNSNYAAALPPQPMIMMVQQQHHAGGFAPAPAAFSPMQMPIQQQHNYGMHVNAQFGMGMHPHHHHPHPHHGFAPSSYGYHQQPMAAHAQQQMASMSSYYPPQHVQQPQQPFAPGAAVPVPAASSASSSADVYDPEKDLDDD